MNKDYILKFVDETLTDKRKIHTAGVRDMALKLCDIYGADKEKVEIAALCHDLYRGKSIEELNNLVRKYNLGDEYIDNPNLAHGKIAAAVMKDILKIDDDDILNAVSFHTTGRPAMSQIEKIIYISDAIEINRKPYPNLEKIRELAPTDLNKACEMSLKNTINFLNELNKTIDEDTLDAYRYFQER